MSWLLGLLIPLCPAVPGIQVLSDQEVADKLIVVTQTRRSAKLDENMAKLIHDGLSAYEAELGKGSRPQARPPRAPSRCHTHCPYAQRCTECDG